jgi:hypothetical protein
MKALAAWVPVEDLEAGNIVIRGTLGGLCEVLEDLGCVCGYQRWRYVRRDEAALGVRGVMNLRAGSEAQILLGRADTSDEEES